MPINIPSDLPARSVLEQENIFVMTDARASSQDIRPLRIAIVNLMPTKIATEVQLLRLLGNSPLQVNVTLIRPENHQSKNTASEHLERFYTTFSKVKHLKFDGMIITGAPVEQLPFEEVDYWPELAEIMDYSIKNVFSTLYICWGAQAGLYHRFGVPKYPLANKKFGIFENRICKPAQKLFRGFDDAFHVPQSRHTMIRSEDIINKPELEILAEAEDGDVCVVMAKDTGEVFMTGHLEYDEDTLSQEYWRDVKRGLNPLLPENYFRENNPELPPKVTWRAHAHLFFNNWLNYHVYQETPFDMEKIEAGVAQNYQI